MLIDVFLPNKVLADFCIANFFSRGALLVPPTSNVSIFRQIDGMAMFQGDVAGAIIAEGILYQYGYTLITVDNSTADGSSNVPADPTTFSTLYAAQSFDIANQTQIWQSGEPGIQCQTLDLSFQIVSTNNASDSVSGFTPPVGSQLYSVLTNVFNQCTYDTRFFVGIVGGVGGAIILATIIAAIVSVCSSIKKSKNKHGDESTKYTEMER